MPEKYVRAGIESEIDESPFACAHGRHRQKGYHWRVQLKHQLNQPEAIAGKNPHTEQQHSSLPVGERRIE